jgi:aminobenzoyl-glutamate utilization protein A
MAETTPRRDRLVDLRRTFHRYPEPAWCEFWTTDRIVSECESIGVDEVAYGPDVLSADDRDALPAAETLDEWLERARERGANSDRLDRMAGGVTGALATIHGDREGPTVAVRVDIDALPQRESDGDAHAPASRGFRSENEGYMHACGHDAHITIGLGVLAAFADGDFPGTLKVLFQPSEEVIGGARAMVERGVVDDVDALLAVHVGLGYGTGEVVAGMEGFLAVSQFHTEFAGESAHAGARPNEGRNAVQALGAAIQGLYGIPRHEDGETRINAGRVEGGTATNIVPEHAQIEGEVRGETTELMVYMREHADRIMHAAGAMHDCEVDVERTGEAPTANADESVVDAVEAAANDVSGVTAVHREGDLGGSEDAALLMRRVQESGGRASFVCIGTDHPGGHHTGTFDVDEDTLEIGVATLTRAIERLQAD